MGLPAEARSAEADGTTPVADGGTLWRAMDLLRWRRGPRGDQDAAAEGELPTQINHYRVRRVLGQGGMGVVYLAEDERLGREVALKVLRDSSSDPSARLRLVREARIAAGVSHPLICQVFELGEWNNQPFIAMELIDGEPLAARLSGGRCRRPTRCGSPWPSSTRSSVLHRRGIIHRDLKPSNVFVTATGRQGRRLRPRAPCRLGRTRTPRLPTPASSSAHRSTRPPNSCSATRWTSAPICSPRR